MLKLFKKRRQRISKADQFDEAATKLEKRAAEMRNGGFRTQITDPAAEMVQSLATFVRAIGNASAAADRATNVIIAMTAVGIFVAVTNVWLVFVQIREANKATNTQNAISLNGQFFHDPINLQIIDAIENHRAVLIQHHGHTTPTELDNYLGDLDTIHNAYVDKQISEEELCGSFSTVVTETFDNREIQQYLRDNPNYFGGAFDLRDIVKNSKRAECH